MPLTTPPAVPMTVLPLLDGRELAFAEYGDPAGVPVFAFHGTPGSHLQLAPASAAAAAAGIRLVVPDRPGYGHSSLSPHRRLLDWPADVAAVADHLGIERFAVLGVSGGGPHALACAVAVPQRLTAVVVVSSPSPDAAALRNAGYPAPVRLLGRVLAVRALVRAVVAVLLLLARRFPLAVLRAARRSMPEADRRIVDDPFFRTYFVDSSRRTAATAAAAVTQDVALFDGDWHVDLRRIDVPVTVWHGTDDRLVEPGNAELLADAIPTATLELCFGAGHLLFAEHADEILRELSDALQADDRAEAVSPSARRTR